MNPHTPANAPERASQTTPASAHTSEIVPVPSWVTDLLEPLRNAGWETYLVGGCVRDALMGKEPHDYDACSNATWQQSAQVLKDAGVPTSPTGIKHGTITVIHPDGDPTHIIELTTYRAEGPYTDGRRPDSVRFVTSIRQDLSRRDLTINAIAFDPFDQRLEDPFSGRQDVALGLIRAVGDPFARFEEDALRVLRAMRFAAQLGFDVETSTAQAIHQCGPLLDRISAERKTSELTRLLCGAHAARVLREFADVVFVVLPMLAPMATCPQVHPRHLYNVWEHTIRAVEAAPALPALRWAALFHDSGKPTCLVVDVDGTTHFHRHPLVSSEYATMAFSRRLRAPRELSARVIKLVFEHEIRYPFTTPIMRRQASRFARDLGGQAQGIAFYQDLLALREADLRAQNPALSAPDAEQISRSRQELPHMGLIDAATPKDLAVDGRFLMDALGLSPGPELGRVIDRLLDAVVEEHIPNTPQDLVEYARKTILRTE